MMRASQSAAVQQVFRALADPTRRLIIEMVAERPRSIAEIAARFEVSRPAIAKHLHILEEGDIVVVNTKGRERINSLNPEALKTAFDWLTNFDSFWDERLGALKTPAEK